MLLSPYPVCILHKHIYVLFLNYSLQPHRIFSNAELDEVVLIECIVLSAVYKKSDIKVLHVFLPQTYCLFAFSFL